MQLASHGASLKAASRKAPNILTPSTRSIHIPSYARLRPTTTQKLFAQSRTLLSRFFTHLTAPGLKAPISPSIVRSIHGSGASTGRAAIQQGFSLPVRTALSRPLQAPHLPRAPGAVPRSIAQVGLGTARNFSSGRPIFQNLMENVPVVGRAFYEADWEVKMRKEREMMKGKHQKSKYHRAAGKEILKPKAQHITIPKQQQASTPVSEVQAELEHYFPMPSTAPVTTYLLIPLAPTPSTRLPLPASPPPRNELKLLHLPFLASIHSMHQGHALRVSALFSRLDAANVWARGVQCSAYSDTPGDLEGVCTVLRVEFKGWRKEEVRGVIGESGTGWCILEEDSTEDDNADNLFDSILDDDELSSVYSGEMDMGMSMSMASIDPAQSFVLPTLDFSSSFMASAVPSPSSSLVFPGGSSFDPWLDESPAPPAAHGRYSLPLHLSSSPAERALSSTSMTSNEGWLEFSSEFAGRAELTRGEVAY